MEDKLLSCPFCCGEAEEQWTPYPLKAHKVLYTYWCKDCNASIIEQETKEEAIKAWNTRSTTACEPTCQELSVANTQIGNMKRPKVWIEDKIKEFREKFVEQVGRSDSPFDYAYRMKINLPVSTIESFLRSCLEDYGKGRE